MNRKKRVSAQFSVLLIILAFGFVSSAVAADRSRWEYQKMDLRMTGKGRVKGIRYPRGKKPILLKERKQHRARPAPDADTSTKSKTSTKSLTAPPVKSISVSVIDSPPVDGFVPWIVVGTSNARAGSDDLDFEAHPVTGVTGVPTTNLRTNYVIGIFDTGASTHIMGYGAASRLNLTNPTFLTDNVIEITGVTGSVETNISYPLGIFAGGLDLLEPNGLDESEYFLNNTSAMVGTTNMSIIVGQDNGPLIPDLPTALGSPLNVYFTAVFRNDQSVTVRHDGETYTGPSTGLYRSNSLSIPDYPIKLPLELRPMGGISVQYIPDFNLFLDLDDIFNLTFDTPGTPSVVIGNLSQSVTFVHSVDMTDNGNTAYDKNRFLLDTGAQVSVIGSRIGARLGLDPANPDFEVEIQGVTGKITYEPGFYIDSVDIPALGEWLRFTNVPVVLLDVASPEGGTFDGIIGMNLFTEYNFVLRGGGLFLMDDPVIELERIEQPELTGDIVPAGGDGAVNLRDFAAFSRAWRTTAGAPDWNEECDIAPIGSADSKIDVADMTVFAGHWLDGVQ